MKNRIKNNKINQILNIVESVALLLLITIVLFSSAKFFIMPTIFNVIIKLVSLVSIATIISIELFFFLIEYKKYKLFTLIYYASSAAILLLINLLLPLVSILSLVVCNIIKNIYRLKNIELIYSYDNFATICKIYGIKTRKARGRKPSTKKVKATTISKTKTNTKKTSKSYA